MSSMDPTKVDSSILSETMRRTSLRPFHFRQLLNTKSSSLMKQITQGTTYNSSYGRLLRNLLVTAASSSPAITRTKSSNPSTPDVPSSNLESREKTKQSWQVVSFEDFNKSWIQKVWSMMRKSLQKSSISISPIGAESSTSANGTAWEAKLTQAFLRLSQTSL